MLAELPLLLLLLLLLGLPEPPQAATATAAAKAAAVTVGVRSMAVFLLRPGLHVTSREQQAQSCGSHSEVPRDRTRESRGLARLLLGRRSSSAVSTAGSGLLVKLQW